MLELFISRLTPPYPISSKREASWLWDPESPYRDLQYNFVTTQECNPDQPFDISQGEFGLMETARKDVFYGWLVDPYAPADFWYSRRQDILEGKVRDCYFVPLMPYINNLFKHPESVMKAMREWISAREKYGENFQSVFTNSQNDPHSDRYFNLLYVYSPRNRRDKALSTSIERCTPFQRDSLAS